MDNNKRELRCYGLVPYNISPIQQAIQYGHAKDEYSITDNKDHRKLYDNWVRNWKTYIILNGGTTNRNRKNLGTLNKHFALLKKMGVPVYGFYEPDLGDQLTGVTFIVDDRVFGKEYEMPKESLLHPGETTLEFTPPAELDKRKIKYYTELFGDEQIAWLRVFCSRFKLA
jgi:hypothetical protein